MSPSQKLKTNIAEEVVGALGIANNGKLKRGGS